MSRKLQWSGVVLLLVALALLTTYLIDEDDLASHRPDVLPEPNTPSTGVEETLAAEPGDLTGEVAAARIDVAPARTLTVRVVYETDEPAPGITVARSFVDMPHDYVEDRTSDADGVARFEGGLQGAGSVWVQGVDDAESAAEADGALPLEAVLPGQTKELTIVVDRTNEPGVHVRVVARESGAPIEGARVCRTRRKGGRIAAVEPGEVLALTDANGRASLPARTARGELLLILAQNRGAALATLERVHETPEHPREVLLGQSARLTGKIIDESPGPAPGRALSVVLYARLGSIVQPPWSLSFGGEVAWETEVDRDGSFELALPATIGLTAEVTSDGEVIWKPKDRLRHAPGAHEQVTWTVGHLTTVLVTAIETDGRPAANLDISLDEAPQRGRRYERQLGARGRRGRTDASGRFSFERVPTGNFCVAVSVEQSSSGEPPAPALVRFETRQIDQTIEVVLPVHRGLFIRGVALDWEGKPMRMTVQAIGEEDGSMLGHGDRDGSFSIGPLLPGSYQLHAGTFGSGQNAPALPVSAAAGDEGVIVQLRRGGVLRGVVVDAQTEKRLAAQVTVHMGGEFGYTSHIEDGAFEMEGVVAGFCALSVVTADGRRELLSGIEVEAGEIMSDIHIPVRAATSLDVSYSGPIGRARCEIEVDGVHVDDLSVPTGSSTRFVVPPGEVSVRLYVRQDDGSVIREETRVISMAPGIATQVEF